MAACGGGAPSAPATGTPAASTAASDAPEPSPTRWPGDIVEAVIKLGLLDTQVQSASTDLATAADAEDLKAMYKTTDELVDLVDELQFQAGRVADYPATKAAAEAYAAALPDMLAGAKQTRDAISGSDAAGVTAGTQRLAKGMASYAAARAAIAPLVDEALMMQRQILK